MVDDIINDQNREKPQEHPAWDIINKSLKGSTEDLLLAIKSNNLDVSDQLVTGKGETLDIQKILEDESRSDVLTALKEKQSKKVEELIEQSVHNFSGSEIKENQDVELFKFKKKINDKATNEEVDLDVETALLKDSNGEDLQYIKSGNMSGFINAKKGVMQVTGNDEITTKYYDGSSLKIKDDNKNVDVDLSKNKHSHDFLNVDRSGVVYGIEHSSSDGSQEMDKLNIIVDEEKFNKYELDNLSIKLNDNEKISYKDGEFKKISNDGKETALEASRDKDGILQVTVDNPNHKNHEKAQVQDKSQMQKQGEEGNKKSKFDAILGGDIDKIKSSLSSVKEDSSSVKSVASISSQKAQENIQSKTNQL